MHAHTGSQHSQKTIFFIVFTRFRKKKKRFKSLFLITFLVTAGTMLKNVKFYSFSSAKYKITQVMSWVDMRFGAYKILKLNSKCHLEQ